MVFTHVGHLIRDPYELPGVMIQIFTCNLQWLFFPSHSAGAGIF